MRNATAKGMVDSVEAVILPCALMALLLPRSLNRSRIKTASLSSSSESLPPVRFCRHTAEFTGQRRGEFPVDHFQRNGKRMPGAHRSGYELEAVGELLFKLFHAQFAGTDHIEKRQE